MHMYVCPCASIGIVIYMYVYDIYYGADDTSVEHYSAPL